MGLLEERKGKKWCEKHPERIIEQYCLTCQVQMCLKCEREKHALHKTLTVRENEQLRS